MVSVGLSGCTVAGTQFLDATHQVSCGAGGLGGYSLPKSTLQVSVVDTNTGGRVNRALEGPNVATGPDRDHSYCLDFVTSPTSRDIIDVKKTSNGLLSMVSTDIFDRSADIARTAVETVFTGVIGGAGFPLRGDTIGTVDGTKSNKLRYEFDPFDFVDMAAMNERLNDLGYCIINPGFSFDPDKASINRYCDAPEKTIKHAQPAWVAAQFSHQIVAKGGGIPTTPKAPVVTDQSLLSGLLYRPRIGYEFLIMRRSRRYEWEVARRPNIGLSNISPILSISLHRAFFAQRITVLHFDRGALGNMCVYKGSELVEAAKIPFLIASAIVSLPAELIQVKINSTTDRKRLAQVEEDLALFQAAIIQAAVDETNPQIPQRNNIGTQPTKPAQIAEDLFTRLVQEADATSPKSVLTDAQKKTFFGEDTEFFGCPQNPAFAQDPITGFQ